jgi:uncharacterized repeat protein (TIGR01451 family)
MSAVAARHARLCSAFLLAALLLGFSDATAFSSAGAVPRPGQAPRLAALFPIPVGGPAMPIAARRPSGRVQVLIELADPPAALAYAAALGDATVSRAQAAVKAAAAGKAQVARIVQRQAQVAAAAAALPYHAREIYRVQKAYNGISVYVDAAGVKALRQLPGVRAVHAVALEYPNNAVSVPFIGAPPVWDNSLGLGQDVTGAGVRIGIIDTGVDYQHPMFGGSGLLADYQANDTTVISDTIKGQPIFPTAKVVGGFDFAGDAYDGTNLPQPDPDPMDCNDHGSHVAGTAAGFGVRSDGTTYTGPYGTATPFSSLRIGPGVAPGALLYALRVFGCTGGTGLAVQAIDWALDPDGDGDLSDHLDVINMSFGSPFGRSSDTTAVAAENAAQTGVIVVAAAGNDGDTYFIGSSPAAAGRALAVAAVGDPVVLGALVQVSSPAAVAGAYPAQQDLFGNGAPPPAGQTAAVVAVASPAGSGTPGEGCDLPYGNAAAVAGKIAWIERGDCGFQKKVANAQASGAIGAIVVDNVAGDPFLLYMGPDASQPPITIPAVFISFADGSTLRARLPLNATLSAATGADTIAFFSSRGPRSAASPMRLKPDIAAPGEQIKSTLSGITCKPGGGCILADPSGFFPGGQSLILSGTSMATPHIAGTLALLRELHPDWSVEELKALAMEGALHSPSIGPNGSGGKLAPARIGAGREDVGASAQNEVTAFNADDGGLVSLSFEREVVGSLTQGKTVRLVNHGATDQTYSLGIDLRAAPLPGLSAGVSFSLPGGASVTVPAGQSITFEVRMDADAAQLDHLFDPTTTATQLAPPPLDLAFGSVLRQFLSEEWGYLDFSQGGQLKMRLPLYSAARAASAMSGAAPIATGGAPSGTANIGLSGTGFCTGTCSGNFPYNEVPLLSAFELQAVGSQSAAIPAYTNIHYGGVAYDPQHDLLMFGVSSFGPWSSPTDVAFNILIDPAGGTQFDHVLFNSNLGTMAAALFGNGAASAQDTFVGAVYDAKANTVSVQSLLNGVLAGGVDSRVFDNNVMVLAASPAALGITGGTHFSWAVQTCAGSDPLCLNGAFDLVPGPFSWDYAAASQGLDFSGLTLREEQPGDSLPVTFNLANLALQGSPGALLLHHHNAEGTRAQVIPVEGMPSADLALAKTVSPPAPALGQSVTFTVTVFNNGPSDATGVVVLDQLPAGLQYVSDDGGGAYDPATGRWTVGPLPFESGAALHVVATVLTTDPIDNVASIAKADQLDPNPANDQAKVSLMAPRQADLALTMGVSPPSVMVGQPLTYTLTLVNHGADQAYGVKVDDSFPVAPGLTAASFSASQGVFDAAGSRWSVPTLAKGGTATLALTVNAPSMAGNLTNRATASAATVDPDSANNTASASALVLSPAAVSGTKTVTGSLVTGGTVTYTIVLSNASAFPQQDNPGDEFDDQLPPALLLLDAMASSGTATVNLPANTVAWNGSIPGRSTVTITLHAAIAGGTPAGAVISNQGTIHFDATGGGANSATALTNDPSVGAGSNPTTFQVAAIAQIPTLSGSGLALFGLALAGAAYFLLRRRHASV